VIRPHLIDTVTALYDYFLSIGDDKHIKNAVLIHLVMGKVDAGTKRKWEEQLDYTSLPLWSECESALNKRYQHKVAEEACKPKIVQQEVLVWTIQKYVCFATQQKIIPKRTFLSLERRLPKDPSLKKMYIEFMEEGNSRGRI